MGVDLKSTAIDTSHALRTSKRVTQFTGRFQTAPRLKARKDSFPVFPISIVQVEFVHDQSPGKKVVTPASQTLPRLGMLANASYQCSLHDFL